MRQRSENQQAKARQASRLAEIRAALIAAGCDTISKQAVVLGVGRSTAWTLLNSDTRAGPSAKIIKRVLSSDKLPAVARREVKKYVKEKRCGLYGHSNRRVEAFRDQFPK